MRIAFSPHPPQALRRRGVSFLVSPYEADAQLAFLCESGAADGIITEDSDTLPYRCSTVLFKLDKEGSALAMERTPSAGFFRRFKAGAGGKGDTISLAGFRDATVRPRARERAAGHTRLTLMARGRQPPARP